MMEFIQNPWVVGIIGGTISGIIVFFITRWIMMHKDKSIYYENIRTANADIVRMLKPYVVEKGLPDEATIDALIVSTARKYRVNADELYSVRAICEDLMCEIIENAYFSSDKKQELFIQLQQYLEALRAKHDEAKLVPDIEVEIEKRVAEEKANYRRRYISILSAIISSLAVVGTFASLIMSFSDVFGYKLPDFSPDDEKIILIIAIGTSVILGAAAFLIVDYKRKQRQKGKKDE